MEKSLRQYGPYALMLLGIAAIQLFLAVGAERQMAGGGADQAQTIEHVDRHVASARVPSMVFFVMAGVLFAFGLGLVFDTVYFMRWMLARSAGLPLIRVGAGRSSPWEAADAAKCFVIFFFALSCTHLLLRFFSWERWALFVSSTAVYAVMLAVIALWLKRRRGVLPSPTFAMRELRLGLEAYFAFVPALAALLFISLSVCQAMGVEAQPHELVHMLQAERDPMRLVFIGVLSVLVGPIMEEIIFRWITYGALRKKMGVTGAACGSAMLFAIAHANTAQMLPVFGMGIVLALLYEHTGNLVASIGFHVLNNVLALILSLAIIYGTGGAQ